MVARLVGDRPIRSLIGDGPEPAAPAGASVQRVTWQHHEARAATVPLTAAGLDRSEPHAESQLVAAASGSAPSGAGGRSTPVQRWVGALPGSPSPSVRPDSGGGNIPATGRTSSRRR